MHASISHEESSSSSACSSCASSWVSVSGSVQHSSRGLSHQSPPGPTALVAIQSASATPQRALAVAVDHSTRQLLRKKQTYWTMCCKTSHAWVFLPYDARVDQRRFWSRPCLGIAPRSFRNARSDVQRTISVPPPSHCHVVGRSTGPTSPLAKGTKAKNLASFLPSSFLRPLLNAVVRDAGFPRCRWPIAGPGAGIDVGKYGLPAHTLLLPLLTQIRSQMLRYFLGSDAVQLRKRIGQGYARGSCAVHSMSSSTWNPYVLDLSRSRH
ncbi:hypothetical protein B0H21DRAFT_50081 [Amylocystis lapponica]|nr:hypothetical protein B0H21DRAFT_50081 [Amylocystis lapponica]